MFGASVVFCDTTEWSVSVCSRQQDDGLPAG